MVDVVGVSQGSYVVVAGNLRGSYVVVILDSDDPSTWIECSDASGGVKSGTRSALVKENPLTLC